MKPYGHLARCLAAPPRGAPQGPPQALTWWLVESQDRGGSALGARTPPETPANATGRDGSQRVDRPCGPPFLNGARRGELVFPSPASIRGIRTVNVYPPETILFLTNQSASPECFHTGRAGLSGVIFSSRDIENDSQTRRPHRNFRHKKGGQHGRPCGPLSGGVCGRGLCRRASDAPRANPAAGGAAGAAAAPRPSPQGGLHHPRRSNHASPSQRRNGRSPSTSRSSPWATPRRRTSSRSLAGSARYEWLRIRR